jgi:hypothetical protein
LCLPQLSDTRLSAEPLNQHGLGEDGQPEQVVGVPVPVLDETTEGFWWDTGNYFFLPAANPPKRGQHWYYAYARTLPGYPTFTRDHGGPGVRR